MDFFISEKDCIDANKLFCKPSQPMVGLAILVFMCAVYTYFTSDNQTKQFIALFGSIGSLLGYLTYMHLYIPLVAKKHYRSYKALREKMNIQLSNDLTTLYIKAESGESKIVLSDLAKWRENGEMILIFSAPCVFHIIPKRIGNIVEQLPEMLKATIGNAT